MKVLIISHNPVSTFNNMGKTFLSLFSSFPASDLCQLYVRPTTPDVMVCDSYYRITDKQALKSVFGICPGGEVSRTQIEQIIEQRQSGELPPPPAPVGTASILLFIRDIVWKLSRWYSKKLKNWIECQNPTCIFLAPGYSGFIYDIALTIAKDYNLPIVTYICDDYYFINPPKGLVGKWHFSILQKKTDKLMKNTSELVVISEELKKVYNSNFGVPSCVIMTGAAVNAAHINTDSACVQRISYFGNLSDGRHISLAEIGHALDEINRTCNTNITLNVYSADTSPERLSVFDNIHSVRLCGFVSGKAYEEAFSLSDMLVHAESFVDKHIDRVKHSVSTKIADSLASGKPLLAYGPESISSMKHLIRHNCAVVITSHKELCDKLKTTLWDKEALQTITLRALKVSSEYHNNQKNSEILKSVFAQIDGAKK